MLNSNLSKVKTYVGNDGKIHFVNSAGADTALNFSSGLKNIKCVVNYLDKDTTVINIGFRPKKLIMVRRGYAVKSAAAMSITYDQEVSSSTYWYYGGEKYEEKSIGADQLVSINDNGFTVTSTMIAYNYSYLAIG